MLRLFDSYSSACRALDKLTKVTRFDPTLADN